MDKIAIINKRGVELSDEDRLDAEEFHRNRLAFCWIKDKLVFNIDKSDDRDHMHWIMEDFNVSREEFETYIRGYASIDEMILYVGSDFRCLTKNELDLIRPDFILLVKHYKEFFGIIDELDCIPLYHGVNIGRVGDIWEPIEKLCDLSLKFNENSFRADYLCGTDCMFSISNDNCDIVTAFSELDKGDYRLCFIEINNKYGIDIMVRHIYNDFEDKYDSDVRVAGKRFTFYDRYRDFKLIFSDINDSGNGLFVKISVMMNGIYDLCTLDIKNNKVYCGGEVREMLTKQKFLKMQLLDNFDFFRNR